MSNKDKNLKKAAKDQMMEFWPEHQGYLPLYARFGTVPGRNCAHNYHDRHQTTHYPFSYGEQQDQVSKSSYWTLPGLRTGGALPDGASWMDSELSVPSSSRFPFILDRQTQPYEIRGREWTAALQAAGDYERGFQRERWQRRWESPSPVHYRSEVSTKRSNTSCRELKAWAAQYSHSLPRRKHGEEELRGKSHGLLESSGATERNKSGTNPQGTLLQQVRQSADINKSGVWDKSGTCHPLQAPAPDTRRWTVDTEEKAGYQRRFSHPPGYSAPPPYNSPHKCTPLMHHSNTCRDQDDKRQTYWSQPTLKKQGASDLQYKNNRELTKPDGNQNYVQLEGLKQRTPGTDALKAGSPITVQDIRQHPQMIQTLQNTKAAEQTSSKVIEGRKFQLNKKTGGMTIFCLVSRIADTTETSSWALRTSQANIQSLEFSEISKGQRDSGDIHQTPKFADEVDSRVATLTEPPISDISARNVTSNAKKIPINKDSDSLEDNLSKRTETGDVTPEKNNLNSSHSTFGRQLEQCAQPVPVKYPLWREPNFLSRTETESPSTFLKANNEKGEESGGLQSQEKSAAAHPTDVKVRRLDIKRDTQSEDSESLLVIDTTRVVVKMELIPSAKKDHVHYLSSTIHTGENPLHIQSSPVLGSNSPLKTEQESDMGGGDTSFTCKPPSSFSERENLVDCARIPGIPLHDSTTERQCEEAPSFRELCVEMAETSSTNDNHDGTGQFPDTTEDHLVTHQTEDQVQNEDSEHFAGPQEQVSALCEEKNISQLKRNINISQEAKESEESHFEPTGEKGTTEQNGKENWLVENHPNLQHPNPCKGLSKSLISHSNLTSLSYISQSTTEEDLELAELGAAENLAPYPNNSSLPDATSDQQPSLLTPGSTKSSPRYPSPSYSPDLIDRLTDAVFGIEDKDDKSESSQDDFSDASMNLEEQEVVSQKQVEFEKSDDDIYGEENNITDEQQTEADSDHTECLVQTVEPSKENAIVVIILQKQADDVTCNKVSHLNKEQQQKASNDSTRPENTIDSQDKINILLFNNDQEGDVSCETESCVTGEQSEREASEGTGHVVQMSDTFKDTANDCQSCEEVKNVQKQVYFSQEETVSCATNSLTAEEPSEIESDEKQSLSQENAADCQTQVKIDILQMSGSESEPSGPDCKMFPSPDLLLSSELPSPSNTDHFSDSLELDSACCSALDPISADVGIRETISHSLLFHSCEESSPFSSSSTNELAPHWTSNISTPAHGGGEGVSFDLPHEEHQYPKSLWDAVNRIRRHTAPDSENEEEEVSEQWDPESIRDVVLNMDSETVVKQDPCCKEQSAEEDTLSCSSHGSGDTVIVTEQDEVGKIQLGQVFGAVDGEESCSDEVNDETAAKKEREDEPFEGDMKELCLSEETSDKDMKVMEMEQK